MSKKRTVYLVVPSWRAEGLLRPPDDELRDWSVCVLPAGHHGRRREDESDHPTLTSALAEVQLRRDHEVSRQLLVRGRPVSVMEGGEVTALAPAVVEEEEVARG